MGECSWLREVSRTRIASNRDGTLIRYVTLDGTSRHPDDKYPTRFRRSLHVRWERNTSYVFCSKTRPAYVFASGLDGRSRWVAHLLDLYNLFGYNGSSAIIYLRACERIGPPQSLQEIARRRGYRAGTPSAQIILNKPTDIANRRIVAAKVASEQR